MNVTTRRPPGRATFSQPSCFSVPRNESVILDLSAGATTPERRLKDLLLCKDGSNVIAAVGMGGAGKTVIACKLGHDEEVQVVFYNGVWFIQLGQDITLEQFWAKIRRLVRRVCPDFSGRLSEMLAEEVGADDIALELVAELREKHFALIIDDAWKQSDAYRIVAAIAVEVSGHGGSMKMLVTTRGEDVAQNPLTNAVVEVTPRSPNGDIAKGIICHAAGVTVSSVKNLVRHDFEAFEKVLRRCDGLPLALSVAGGAVRGLMKDAQEEAEEQRAWATFCSLLEKDYSLLGEGGSTRHRDGVFACIRMSVEALEKTWARNFGISADEVLRSLSIISKQAWVPLDVLRVMWSVEEWQAARILGVFSESNLLSRVLRDGVLGVQVHDLVIDCASCVVSDRKEDGEWDERLLQGYRGRLSGIERDKGDLSYLSPWWCLEVLHDKYLIDNVVRHMLRCGLENEAIALLCDYRWIEFVNDDEEQLPFHKLFGDLKLLKHHLRRGRGSVHSSGTDSFEALCRGVDFMIEGTQMCMYPCSQNRAECSFQLFGRLQELRERCAVVGRCLWSMEAHARRPWVRPGPGVVSSAGRNLKRKLPVGFEVSCMERGLGGDELVIGGRYGELDVINVHSGRKRCSLCEHTRVITGICVDRSRGEIITCSDDGSVIVWQGEERVRSFKPFGEGDDFAVTCIEVLEEDGLVACGSRKGNIRVMSKRTGGIVRDLVGHTGKITSLAATNGGRLLISGSDDGTVRRWDLGSGEAAGEVVEGHEQGVMCVSVSSDGRLIASGFSDGSVRLWDVQSGAEICAPLTGHESAVDSVAFSGDVKFLYSGGYNELYVWDVSSPQDGVQLKHKLEGYIGYVDSLCVSSDGTELFTATYSEKEVSVWRAHMRGDVLDDEVSVTSERSFLNGIRAVGVSADGSTMATIENDSIKLRRVCDVSNAVDDVLAEFDARNLPLNKYSHVRCVAVTDDKQLVAFTYENMIRDNLMVYVVRIHTRDSLYEFTDLIDWLDGLRADSTEDEEFRFARISVLEFSSDCTHITAVARVQQNSDGKWLSKSMTWDVSTGTLCAAECLPTAGGSDPQSTSDVVSSDKALPRLEIKSGDGYYLSNEVRLDGTAHPFTAGTLDFKPGNATYDSNTGRLWIVTPLWIVTRGRRLFFVDLIYDGARTEADVDPPQAPTLPLLPERISSQSAGIDKPPKYKVFISHAGTDKLAFAVPLHGGLKKLDIDAFLDMINLRPGNDAPAEMIDAMNTAPIGIFIVSPQFAARPWTIKELMCFLERDRVAMERGLPRPIIIPVFLRLTVAQCKDPALVLIRDENGESVFEKEGFFEREKYGKASSEDVKKSMKRLASFTGIENKEGANSNIVDGEAAEEGRKRKVVVDKMIDAIVEACDTHRAQGKSRMQVQAGPSTFNR